MQKFSDFKKLAQSDSKRDCRGLATLLAKKVKLKPQGISTSRFEGIKMRTSEFPNHEELPIGGFQEPLSPGFFTGPRFVPPKRKG